MTTAPRAQRLLLAAAMLVGLGLSGCGAGSGPPPADPTSGVDTTPPFDPRFTGGGSSGSDPGTGIGARKVPPAEPAPVDPGAGQPMLVRPVAGRLNPHPVAPTVVQASVDGRRVLVKITWYGGVDPCFVLDSVRVEVSGSDIALTLFEGASDATAMCIEIAVLKATIVDLGELAPGAWRIVAPGSDAAPIEITIG